MKTLIDQVIPGSALNQLFLVLFVVLFVAIVSWCLRPAKKNDYDHAAHLPLED